MLSCVRKSLGVSPGFFVVSAFFMADAARAAGLPLAAALREWQPNRAEEVAVRMTAICDGRHAHGASPADLRRFVYENIWLSSREGVPALTPYEIPSSRGGVWTPPARYHHLGGGWPVS